MVAERACDRNKEALDKSKASAAAAPGLIPLHRGSISNESVVQLVKMRQRSESPSQQTPAAYFRVLGVLI